MSQNNIKIRSEINGDENAIDMVVCRAFRKMDEAHLVRMIRTHYPAFDRRYSVTAWEGNKMVGHILFSPANIRLMGKTVKALAVAPVAVIPEKQRCGIGGQMLRFGHELGKRDSFALAFLAGHPSYYPRYGYKPCYGFAKVTINIEALAEPRQKLDCRSVQPSDIPWLVKCFAAEWADVDFSWLWDANMSEWVMPGSNTLMWWTKDNRRAGYTVGWPGGKRWKFVIADDPALARDVIATIRPESLEQHPSGWLARNVLDSEWAKTEVGSNEAAMAYELQEGVLEPYLDALKTKKRLPGFCNWVLPLLIC